MTSMDYKDFRGVLQMKLMEVLKEDSNEENVLALSEITESINKKLSKDLFEDSCKFVDNKIVKRHLDKLKNGGYIKYKKGVGSNGEGKIAQDGYYYEHKFSDADLRFLIDGLLSFKHIPREKCKELINEIENLGSKSFSENVNNIRNLPLDMPNNSEIFNCIKMLDKAISQKKQIEFSYNDFDEKGKLVPRVFKNNGIVKKYVVNPYQMVVSNNRYYLICNFEKYSNVENPGNANHSNLSHYRIDRITDVKILDIPAKKKKDLDEEINMPTHMAEHIYMFSGKSDRVRMHVDVNVIGDVIDWFGKDVTFFNKTENSILASVVVNLQAMRYWAIQYVNFVEVLHPQELREQIKKDLLAAVEKYKD